MGLEGPVPPHVVRQLGRLLPDGVEGGVVEEVHRPHELPVGDLEAQAKGARRAVEAADPVLCHADGEDGPRVGAPVPPGGQEGPRPGLQDLPHGRQPGLGAHQGHGVVLPHVLPGNLRQLVGAHGGHGFPLLHLVRSGVDALDDVVPLGSDEGQEVVGLLRAVEEHPAVGLDVPHLEAEALVHGGVDDQAGGAERVREHAVDGEVEGPGLRLVHHEDGHGLRPPLLELQLRAAGTHAPHVPREGVHQQVLSGPVEAQGLGLLGALLEGEPRQLVDLGAVDPLAVGHDELQVVAAVGDIEVLQDPHGPGLLQGLLGDLLQPRVDHLVAGDAPHVRLDERQGRLCRHGIGPTIRGGVNKTMEGGGGSRPSVPECPVGDARARLPPLAVRIPEVHEQFDVSQDVEAQPVEDAERQMVAGGGPHPQEAGLPLPSRLDDGLHQPSPDAAAPVRLLHHQGLQLRLLLVRDQPRQAHDLAADLRNPHVALSHAFQVGVEEEPGFLPSDVQGLVDLPVPLRQLNPEASTRIQVGRGVGTHPHRRLRAIRHHQWTVAAQGQKPSPGPRPPSRRSPPPAKEVGGGPEVEDAQLLIQPVDAGGLDQVRLQDGRQVRPPQDVGAVRQGAEGGQHDDLGGDEEAR